MAGSARDSGADQRSWTAIAGDLHSPAVAAAGERGLLLFARDREGLLSVQEHDGRDWAPARPLGVTGSLAEGSFAACGTGDGAVHLLARGADGELLHGIFADRTWSGFESVGVPSVAGVPVGLMAAPTACSRVRGEMDVFAINIAGDLLQAAWNEEGFTPFEPLGPGAPPLAAAACGSRAVALVAPGRAGELTVRWWNAGRWGAAESLGAPEEEDVLHPGIPRRVPFSGAPVACGGGSARLDVFARGAGGDLVHRWWNGREWSPFESLGTPAAAPFTGTSLACAWRRFRLDVFARAADGNLYTRSWP